MRCTNNLLILISSFFLFQCGMMEIVREQDYQDAAVKSSRSKDQHFGEPGSCYEKCIIPDILSDYTYESFAIYTGPDSLNNSLVEEIELEIVAKTAKWVKRKANNCLSKDPDDCLIWCLVEVPAQYQIIRVLSDTTLSKHYEIQEIQFGAEIIKKGGFSEWREVLCSSSITPGFITDLQEKLSLHGFYKDTQEPKIDAKLKQALTDFQQANSLPVGHFNLETLELLGI